LPCSKEEKLASSNLGVLSNPMGVSTYAVRYKGKDGKSDTTHKLEGD
jgi:hypothetical protein